MSNRADALPFFPHLLGTRQNREVKVSAAFATCFHHSKAFQSCVTKVLSRLCGVRGAQAAQWSCQSEVHQPKVGRIDLQVTGTRSGRDPIVFWIENKVEAPLTKQQLRRYRRIAAGRVAVTKHWFGATFYFPPKAGEDPTWNVVGKVGGKLVERDYSLKPLAGPLGAIDIKSCHRNSSGLLRNLACYSAPGLRWARVEEGESLCRTESS